MGSTGALVGAEPRNAEQWSAEREELEWLLHSGVLGRSANIARVLRYVCEEHFNGRAEDLKEYTLAVEALGRPPEFDPQTDTIVRVTVHSLRKRLAELYQTEGANRPLRIVIPAGHYAPHFVPNPTHHTAPLPSDPAPLAADHALSPSAPSLGNPVPALATPGSSPRGRWLALLLLCVLGIAAALLWSRQRQNAARHSLPTPIAAALPSAAQNSLRLLLGQGRHPYTDRSGQLWGVDRFCQGGSSVSVADGRISGTEDPYLYVGGVRGITHCIFPAKRGLYELHLHFAETSDLLPVTRPAALSINAGPTFSLDVVDEAGANSAALTTVITSVSPENDGAVHLDFTSEISSLAAVELLPASSPALLPVRILASSQPFTDDKDQVWMSDRYFRGGRRGQSPDSARQPHLGIFAADRVGRFSYNIPVVPLARYKVRLYFREPWFGLENGGSGGPGSRVFDVACNGTLLLKNFDIVAEGGTSPVVKTFDHVQASASGRLELSFLPVVNHPVVNAIEILPDT